MGVHSVHEFSAVVYDSSAVITAFESWTAWEASPRFKYSPTPSEGLLKDFMKFGQAGVAGDEQSAPHQGAHAVEHHAELINRTGGYGRFRHAGSLPPSRGTVLSLTPRNLLLSKMRTGRCSGPSRTRRERRTLSARSPTAPFTIAY